MIQRNAIQSWRELGSNIEIILFGSDEGVEDIAREMGLRHVPNVACSEFGTPLISDLFRQAREMTSFDFLCYTNADIIFLQNPLQILEQISFPNFILSGRRWDLNVSSALEFKNGWKETLHERSLRDGKLHPASGMDYFIFPKDLFCGRIPPFAVGRPCWDNWFVCQARKEKIPVIDLTQVFSIVHQNHDYAATVYRKGNWAGAESERNLRLAGEIDHCFTVNDADWRLTSSGLKKSPHHLHDLWNFPVIYEDHPVLGWLMKPIVSLRMLFRKSLRRIRNSVLPAN
ncbi:MAG: glycosyltransferase family 2 protein [Candidatus Omnitrophica bacterium]|nr:glycosyltransferase family 2 protein [Candidatus Omnitrophota bacterium]